MHYLWLPQRRRVYLVFVYSKDDAATLTPEQKRRLKVVAEAIKGDGMKEKLFADLLESMGEALEHARGKRQLWTTVLPPAPEPLSARDVRQLRRRLSASQSVFAHWLNVSTKLVQAWEAGRRAPDGPALLLLRLMERNPTDFMRGLYRSGATRARNPRNTHRAAARSRATKPG